MSLGLAILGGVGSYNGKYGLQRTVSVTLDVSEQPDGYFVVQLAESTINCFVKDGKLNGEYRRVGNGIDEHLLFINGVEAMNLKLVPLDDKLKFQLALQHDLGFL